MKIGQITPWEQIRYKLSQATEADFKSWKQLIIRDMSQWEKNISPEDKLSSEGRNKITSNFLTSFHKTIDKSFGTKRICQHSKFWISEAIKSALRNFKRCKRIHTKWCDPKSSKDLEDAKKHLDKLIDQSTSSFWSNYMSEMSNLSGKPFWNKVKNITDHRSRNITQPLINDSDNLKWEDDEILNILVDKHINRVDINRKYSFDENFCRKINSENESLLSSEGSNPEIFERQISIKEIQEELSNMNGQGSPGPPSEGLKDSPGIPPSLLKKASEELSPFLKVLFDILWSAGDFPSVLKEDIKFFTSKPNRENYSLAKSYRMLTLSMCVSKLYDSIFSKRFSIWLEQISFDDDQFAYRKNLSCQHAVFKLVQESIEGFNKGHITIAVLIDLEGAFDALWHEGIIHKLHQAGLRGKCLRLIWNILHDRKATVKVNDTQKVVSDLQTGACQGSSSAAVMFTFNIRDMMKKVKSCRIKYSDDGNLYITGPPDKAQEMANLLSQDLNNISKWCFK